MKLAITLHILGGLLVFLGIVLLFPIPVALYFSDATVYSFLLPAVVAILLGLVLFFAFRRDTEISLREGFAIVTFGWLCFALVGALPYYLSGSFGSFIDAFFESMSGFTTTGATIAVHPEELPKSLLVWRAFSQWVGGMGIIVLSLAVLPFLGIGGTQLFHAEVPGPMSSRLKPRIQETAKILWGVYLIFTATCFVLLWAGGMTFLDSLCHAMTTVASGGFSTHGESLAFTQSSYLHWVVIVFMFLTGVNFSLHYHAFKGDLKVFYRSEEFRWFVGILLFCTTVIVFLNWAQYDSFSELIRYSTFQVVSIGTTTGFATSDYTTWPTLGQFLLLSLAVMGGCAGSTSGGMKVVRVLLVIRTSMSQFHQLIHPKRVKPILLDHKPVPPQILQSILGFFILNVFIVAIGALVLSATGLDHVSAGSAAVACLLNIGPALGSLGPMDNYSLVSDLGKVVLSGMMLVGRLETFTVLVLLFPAFWRK